MNKDTIIQKCFGIASVATAKGQASLKKGNEKQIAKYEAMEDLLIKKFIKYIKEET